MKKIIFISIIFFLLSGALLFAKDRACLLQISTLKALQEGLFAGYYSFSELPQELDFGIGTFSDLDGELVLLDRVFYQIKADGKVYKPALAIKTPFAMLVRFFPEKNREIRQRVSLDALKAELDNMLISRNLIYAIKITGNFSYVKTRSVPGQKRPYPRLIEVAQKQPVFEYNRIRGVIVGFYMPDHLKGINMPAYHFHFLSDDKKYGGHLLECRLDEGKIMLHPIHRFKLVLPEDAEFYKVDHRQEKIEEIKR